MSTDMNFSNATARPLPDPHASTPMPTGAAQSAPRRSGQPPANGKTMAWISILGCWPLAIFAIINANKVDDLWMRRDEAGARKAAGRAKAFAIASWVVTGLLVVLMVAAGSA